MPRVSRRRTRKASRRRPDPFSRQSLSFVLMEILKPEGRCSWNRVPLAFFEPGADGFLFRHGPRLKPAPGMEDAVRKA